MKEILFKFRPSLDGQTRGQGLSFHPRDVTIYLSISVFLTAHKKAEKNTEI